MDLAWGLTENIQRAVVLYQQTAQYGFAPAEYEMGLRYISGNGVQKDLQQAVNFYRKAAEQGYAPAQYNLGHCFYHGIGTEENNEQAAYRFLKAAQQDYPQALLLMGECYTHGYGVEQDARQTMEYCLRAADQRFASAQCELGRCYEFDTGVSRDLKRVRYIFCIALPPNRATCRRNAIWAICIIMDSERRWIMNRRYIGFSRRRGRNIHGRCCFMENGTKIEIAWSKALYRLCGCTIRRRNRVYAKHSEL